MRPELEQLVACLGGENLRGRDMDGVRRPNVDWKRALRLLAVQIGPRRLARLAKKTGLTPADR